MHTYKSTEKEDPSPVESVHYAVPDGKRQAVADVDTKVVDTDGRASQVGREVVTDDRNSKRCAPSSTEKKCV